ncbi:MAG: DUF3147 family protein [Bdellovibrionales bacterium]|nr:DUF3147 family protein [Bdellovibrionales bacterium]
MLQYAFKIILTALMVVAISEAAKRWSFVGAIIASLPLTSILAMIWLYKDTNDLSQISQLSMGIFWVVIPSLVFFLVLPLLIKFGWSFWSSLFVSSAATAVTYTVYVKLLTSVGIEF